MQYNHDLTRGEIIGAMLGGVVAFVVFWCAVIVIFAATGPNT